VRAGDLPVGAGLKLLATSPESGPCLLTEHDNRTLYMFNHLEYDAETLRAEYVRDRLAGKTLGIPRNYFPEDDPALEPVNIWQPYAHLLFANWLGEIYRAALSGSEDEPPIRWALTGSFVSTAEGGGYSDLLISAATDDDILPAVLRVLADAGLAPRALKAHWRPDSGQFIELRLSRLHEPVIERIARRLAALEAVSKVAFRANGVLGGWLLGHPRAAEDPQAPGGMPRETSAPPEAA